MHSHYFRSKARSPCSVLGIQMFVGLVPNASPTPPASFLTGGQGSIAQHDAQLQGEVSHLQGASQSMRKTSTHGRVSVLFICIWEDLPGPD